MPSTMLSTLQRQSLPLLLWILLFVRIAYAQTEVDCPAADAACSCSDDNSVICLDLGQSVAMPTFNPSSTVFSKLSFQGDTRILNIQSQAFAGTQFRTLDLSDLGLTSLDEAAFAGFNASVLSELILANNSLRTLPPTVFTGLTSLGILDLRNNYITQLRTNTFSDLRSSLTSIFLSNNLIGNGGLPVGLLNRLDQLTRLEIEDNLLTMWPSAMLAGSTKITELSLGGNRITAFTKSTFNSLKQLIKLSLNRNDIATLGNGTFENLTSLRELDLSVNRLSNLSENSLKGLENLVTLNLSVNSLSDLAVGVFLPVIRLQSLDLSQNLLRQLPDGLFAGKTTLTTLNLSGNNMTISNGTLRDLTSVTQLFLSGNGICAISSSLFGDLSQLRMLDLSDNKIEKMETGLLLFSSKLGTINLSHNKLSEIPPDVFRNGPALTRIDLSRNSIRRINQNTFYNLHLTYIDLSYNEIEFIDPDAFYHIAELSTVLLNHNRFTTVPTQLFSNIPVLQSVNLDYNLIETLPAKSFDWLYIDNLSMVGNKIGTIDSRAFDNVWITKSINLAKNRIEQISDNTFNYPDALSTVSHISLSHNSLTEVTSEMFSGLSGLSSVDMSDNGIHTVAGGAFSMLRTLKHLRLDNNSLQSMEYNWIGSIGTLRTLNLSSNKLNDQALPAMRGLSELAELYLDSNFFTSLVLLPVMTSLNTLSVRNNSISRIDYNGSASLSILNLGQNRLRGDTLTSSLKSFHNLTSLKLSKNTLEVIPGNAFAPFANRLEELDVSSNGLHLESLAAFSELNNIRILTMDDNQLQDLSRLANSPMKKVLRILSVKSNKLNSTVFSVMSNFTKLSKLFLDGNKIDHIPDRVFQSMYNIRLLSLGGNILQTVSGDTFSGLQQNCQHLDLSGNRLSQVNARSFLSLKGLDHLDLSENNLTSITIPPIMPKLKVLNLGGNKLQRFPDRLRRFHGISTLNVSRNSLVSLPFLTIIGNPSDRTVVVDFQQNSLLNFGDLRLIGSFGHVDFSSNNFSDLMPTLLMRAKYIHQFDLSKNKFHVISRTIWQTAYTVNRLNMSGNSLILSLHNPLPNEIEHCRTILTALDLSHNLLSRLNAGEIASLSPSLALLDIRSNKFETLPQSEFNNLTKLTHLFIAENPWNCNCSLVWIRTLLRKDVYIDNAECIVPVDTIGQLVVCYTPPRDCPVPTNDTRCEITTLSTTLRTTPGLYPPSTTTTSTITTPTTTTVPVPTTQLVPINDSSTTEPITSTSSTTSTQSSRFSVSMSSATTFIVADTNITTSLLTTTEVDSKSPTTANFTHSSTSEFSFRTTATATTVLAPTTTILPVGVSATGSVSNLTDTNVTTLHTTTYPASFSSHAVLPSNLTSVGSSIPAKITSTTLFDATASAFTHTLNGSASTAHGKATTMSSTLSSFSTDNATLVVSDLPLIPPSPKDTSTSLRSTHIVTTPLSNQTISTPVTISPSYPEAFFTSSLRANITTQSTVPVGDASVITSTLNITRPTMTSAAEATTVSSTPLLTSTSNDSLAVSAVSVIHAKDTTSSLRSTPMAVTSSPNQTFTTLITEPPSYTMSEVDTSSLSPNVSTPSTVAVANVTIIASTPSINTSVSTSSGATKTVSSTHSYFSTSNASLAFSDVPVIPPKYTTSSLRSTSTFTTPLSNETVSTSVTVLPSYTFSKAEKSSLRPNISTVPVAGLSTVSTNDTISTVSGETKTASFTPSYFTTSNASLAVSGVPIVHPNDSTSSLESPRTGTTLLSNQTFSMPVTELPSYTLSKVDTSSLRPNISTISLVDASTLSANASVSAITSETQTVSSTPLSTSTSNASFVLTGLPGISPKDTTSSLEYTPIVTTALSNQTSSLPVTMPPSYTDTILASSLKPNITAQSTVPVADASIVASTLNISATTSTASVEAMTVSSTPPYSSTINDSVVTADIPVIPPKDASSSPVSIPIATTPLSNQTLTTPVPIPPSYTDRLSTWRLSPNISTIPVVVVSTVAPTMSVNASVSTVSGNDSFVVTDLPDTPPKDVSSYVASTPMATTPLSNQTFSTPIVVPPSYSDRLSTSSLSPNISTIPMVDVSIEASTVSTNTSVSTVSKAITASSYSSTSNDSFVVTDLPVIPPKDGSSSPVTTTPLSNQTLTTPVPIPSSYPDRLSTSSLSPNISTIPVVDVSIVASNMSVNASVSPASEATTASSYSSTSNDSFVVTDLPIIPPKDASSSLASIPMATTPLSNQTLTTPVAILPSYTDRLSTSSLSPNISTIPVVDVSILASTVGINVSASPVNDSFVVTDLPVIPPKDSSSSVASTPIATTLLSNQTSTTPVAIPPSYPDRLSTSSLSPNISTIPVLDVSIVASTVSINASVSTVSGETATTLTNQTLTTPVAISPSYPDKLSTSSLSPNISTIKMVDVSIVASTVSTNASASTVSGEATSSYSSTSNDSFIVTDLPIIHPKDSSSSVASTPMATTPLSNQTFSTPIVIPPSYPDRLSTSSLSPNISTIPVVDVSIQASTVSTNASVSPVNDSFVVTDLPIIPPKDASSSLASTPMATTLLSNQTSTTPVAIPPSYPDRLSTSSLSPNISTIPVVDVSIEASTVSTNASVSTLSGEIKTVSSTPLFTSTDNASFVVTALPVVSPKVTSGTSSLEYTPMTTTSLSNQTFSTLVTEPQLHPQTSLKVDTAATVANVSTTSYTTVVDITLQPSSSFGPNVSTMFTVPVADHSSVVRSTMNISATASGNDSFLVTNLPPRDSASPGSTTTDTRPTPLSNETFSTAAPEPPLHRTTSSKVDTASTIANVSARATTSATTLSMLSTAGVARNESVKPSTVVNITLQQTSSFTANMSTLGLHIFSTTVVPPVNVTTAKPVAYPTSTKSTSTSATSITNSTSTSTTFHSSTVSPAISETTVNMTSIESSTSTRVSNFTPATPRPIRTPGFSPRVTPGPPPRTTSPGLVNVITGAIRVGGNGDDRRTSSSSMDLSWTDKLLVAVTLGVAAVLMLLAVFIGLVVYFAGSA